MFITLELLHVLILCSTRVYNTVTNQVTPINILCDYFKSNAI